MINTNMRLSKHHPLSFIDKEYDLSDEFSLGSATSIQNENKSEESYDTLAIDLIQKISINIIRIKK